VDQLFPAVETSTNLLYATAADLLSGAPVQLRLDLAQPAGDTLPARPAIVWIHGGGFKSGNRSAFWDIARDWARRGYVTTTISYRLDPGNRCQDIQQGLVAPEELATEQARCAAAMLAAQHDAQAAIRWLRANAAQFRIDPTRIAVGGGSAGAVTALNVAQRADDPGTVGAHTSQPSGVGAALAASGCQYRLEDIDAGDAPIHLLASELDVPMPFACVQATEAATRAVGVPVGTRYYLGEATHARALYLKYRAEVDAEWTAFLKHHLNL
jgi:acetyl esterase/lipase